VTNSHGIESADYIPRQKFFEFHMDRRQKGGLREIAPDEKGFLFGPFRFWRFDPFEYTSSGSPTPDASASESTILNCRTCHSGPGIYSVTVYSGSLQPRDARAGTPQLFETDASHQMTAAIEWKQQQYSWGLLQGLWNQSD
jgi:hypothetical protein